MPSPFHQKYSSQNHKIFGENTVPAMPEGPKQEADRRASDSSMTSASSPTERRRSSAAQRFGNLEALKRPQDEHHTNRRQSLQDSYGKVGFLGSMWNNFTRGPAAQPQAQKPKEPRDTTTLGR
ncbi:Nn.00g000960.m01.CDS01 [Neocucurbitaria sp. VM-36]